MVRVSNCPCGHCVTFVLVIYPEASQSGKAALPLALQGILAQVAHDAAVGGARDRRFLHHCLHPLLRRGRAQEGGR